ncbi:DNA primase [Pseudohongiella nitratireducens]|uniref:DNA primase n=1 Tax=Pseudohongiella nitratireducens TaxID=1768907 RepID=A0A916VJ65_9GAMM|nr:DNA primase [Pseudohongiella nitratireducens]MDF1622240.1 DNA primase [Pseudohongiella nitratireducens]GFZ76109.1 DNA primase [Pseudohongiella nitratireducens]
MAGLIPQSFIDDLLSRVDIVEVIDKRVKLRKTGKNYSACCPFHQEKTPSFSVEPDKQFYYCFGCGAGGNALGFVMDFDHKEFPEAVESLANDLGLSVPRESGNSNQRKGERGEHEKLLSALNQASLFFQKQLRQHPSRERAVSYLKARGLTGQIAQRFAIGLAPPGWENLLEAMEPYQLPVETLEKAGLVIKREADHRLAEKSPYYDRFRDRIIFPIRDARGRTLAFGGRVLGDDKPKYLNSPETPVYQKNRELYGLFESRQVLRKPTRFLLVEGYMDVVALAQHGINYAVATLGTATNANHLNRLFRIVPEVIFCFDGDDAGRNAAWRALRVALPVMEDGRQIRFLFLPEGEDPDTLVRKEGAEAFEKRLLSASALSDYFFRHLEEENDLSTLDGKARLFKETMPLLKSLPKGLFQRLMLDRTADITDTSRDTLLELLGNTAPAKPPAINQGDSSQPDTPEPPAWLDDATHRSGPAREKQQGKPLTVKSRVQKPADMVAIELLLQQPELAQLDSIDIATLKEVGLPNIKLLIELIEFARSRPHIDTPTLVGHCYGCQGGNRVTQLLGDEKITPEAGRQEEFIFIIKTIQEEARKRAQRRQWLEQIRPRSRSSDSEPESGPEDR